MFERRLKIFLLILAVLVGVLLCRTAQLQIFQRAYWKKEAFDAAKKSVFFRPSVARSWIVKGASLPSSGLVWMRALISGPLSIPPSRNGWEKSPGIV